jgi:hypothetical protein
MAARKQTSSPKKPPGHNINRISLELLFFNHKYSHSSELEKSKHGPVEEKNIPGQYKYFRKRKKTTR